MIETNDSVVNTCRSDNGPPAVERRVLIIGGSGGIGAAVARRLSAREYRLVVHGGSDSERFSALIAAMRAQGTDVHPVVCHAGDASALWAALEPGGPYDIVICAFGPYIEAPLHQTSADQWRMLCEFNLVLPGIVVEACIPAMRRSGFGRFVFFGGGHTTTVRGFSRVAAYAAVKTGLSSLVKSVAMQYADNGITANLVAPGYVDTEYYEPQRRRALAATLPGGAMVQPWEIAELVAFLVDPAQKNLNGSLISFDQGR